MKTTDRPNWRSSRRWHVMWPAIVVQGGKRTPCTILDISESGARLESIWGPFPKLPMKLECEKFGSLDGRIMWARGQISGMTFDLGPKEAAKVLKPVVPGFDRKNRLVPAESAITAASPSHA